MNTPWNQCPRHPDLARDCDGERVAATYGDTPEERDERLKRIVECVNACAGISDPVNFMRLLREVLPRMRVLAGYGWPQALPNELGIMDAFVALLTPQTASEDGENDLRQARAAQDVDDTTG